MGHRGVGAGVAGEYPFARIKSDFPLYFLSLALAEFWDDGHPSGSYSPEMLRCTLSETVPVSHHG